jgi:hypothetical protein
MGRFRTFQGVRAALTLCSVLAIAVPGAVRAEAPPLCKFDRGGLVVSARDTAGEGGFGIDVEVSDGPLVLTRLSIPTEGRATGCWLTDLDGDRRFEVLLALDEDAGASPARLLCFEWSGSLLESLKLAELDPAQVRLFGGDERIEIRSNRLLRSFASRLQEGGQGPRLHFHYAPETNAWMRLKALKPAAPVSPMP